MAQAGPGAVLTMGPSAFDVLDVLADLIRGGRHCRSSIARGWRVSLPTADRWIGALLNRVPGVVRLRVGKVTWIQWRQRER